MTETETETETATGTAATTDVVLAAVVLDFDGVIVDTESHLFHTWRREFARRGARLDPADYRRVMGRPDAGPLLAAAACRTAPKAVLRAVLKRHRLGCDRLGPMPGVTSLLATAAEAGVPVAVASGSPSRWVRHHLSRLGLTTAFAAVVCRDEVAAGKPAPDAYLAALERIGARGRAALAVEDAPAGCAAAVAAGLRCLVVPGPATRGAAFAGACGVLDALPGGGIGEVAAHAGLRLPGGPR